jgi:hypothetical protein
MSSISALIGLAALLVIAERVLDPGAPGEYVGFTLLSPAAALRVLAIHLRLEARRAG